MMKRNGAFYSLDFYLLPNTLFDELFLVMWFDFVISVWEVWSIFFFYCRHCRRKII